MTHKEIAERLRQIDGGYSPGQELRRLADELDPPRPEPGTVVWCVTDYQGGPERLFVNEADADAYNREQYRGKRDVLAMRLSARILADDEVAVSKRDLKARAWHIQNGQHEVTRQWLLSLVADIDARAEAEEAGR